MNDTFEEIHSSGHRAFVGGNDSYWDSIGTLQFEFLVARGLKASDVLIDLGCGSLRGGSRFIRYLDKGNYIGVDKHLEIIIYGVALELGIDDFSCKQPQLIVSDAFDLSSARKQPTYAIAQSLFTHLNPSDIELCLNRLLPVARRGCKFYGTFFEVENLVQNAPASHSHAFFGYTKNQMANFGEKCGWKSAYIGEWGHPRGQKMMEYAKP